MGVDPAGDDVAARGVDHPVGPLGPGVGQAGLGRGQGRHPLAVDEDVGDGLVGGGDHQPVADHDAAHGCATRCSGACDVGEGRRQGLEALVGLLRGE